MIPTKVEIQTHWPDHPIDTVDVEPGSVLMLLRTPDGQLYMNRASLESDGVDAAIKSAADAMMSIVSASWKKPTGA